MSLSTCAKVGFDSRLGSRSLSDSMECHARKTPLIIVMKDKIFFYSIPVLLREVELLARGGTPFN